MHKLHKSKFTFESRKGEKEKAKDEKLGERKERREGKLGVEKETEKRAELGVSDREVEETKLKDTLLHISLTCIQTNSPVKLDRQSYRYWTRIYTLSSLLRLSLPAFLQAHILNFNVQRILEGKVREVKGKSWPSLRAVNANFLPQSGRSLLWSGLGVAANCKTQWKSNWKIDWDAAQRGQ